MDNDTTLTQDVSNEEISNPTNDERIKLNLKVNGEEIEKEFTQEELKAYIQKGMSADEKFRTAAELKKSVEEEREEIDNLLKSAFEFNNDDAEETTETTIDETADDAANKKDDALISELKKELKEIKNKQLYNEAKNEIAEIQDKRGLNNEQIIELIDYVEKQRVAHNKILSLEDAYKILYFEGRERPNKLTPENGVNAKKQNAINEWKKRILNAR